MHFGSWIMHKQKHTQSYFRIPKLARLHSNDKHLAVSVKLGTSKCPHAVVISSIQTKRIQIFYSKIQKPGLSLLTTCVLYHITCHTLCRQQIRPLGADFKRASNSRLELSLNPNIWMNSPYRTVPRTYAFSGTKEECDVLAINLTWHVPSIEFYYFWTMSWHIFWLEGFHNWYDQPLTFFGRFCKAFHSYCHNLICHQNSLTA